ncbi:hypothetical protein GCM10027187_39990 [Streptosporangium sandarakinum]|uniref:Uncharacterized protein n=1 Tax=Streptosporangium sandarakinum TaxID=1260955 RepID=A0A852V872_9ACTN|nr:hypothetical protein [Streptosporangium sandarakinum]NYF44669.1 hypothetical protein [Streptosporangium sandarakinum]
MPYPPGHAWGVALFLEPADPDLMWRLAEKPYVTFPEDLKHFPGYEENGLVFEAMDRLCVKCWQRFDMCVWEPCLADTTNGEHLRGGNPAERAARTRPAPGTTAAEIMARRSKRRPAGRETVALMQASRLDGLN